MSANPRLRLNYSPHPGQERLHRAFREGARFVVAVCGRRWGKSRSAHEECRRRLLSTPGIIVRWTSPVFSQAKSRFREMGLLLRELGGAWLLSSHKGDLRYELQNGAEIRFVSTHEPENLRGEGIDFLVVDEAGFIAASVWSEVLRPMLTDTLGDALIVGTPRGRGQFLHQCFTRAASGMAGWHVVHSPTWDSPRIPAEEIEAARLELPADAFAQEYGAEFLDSAAGVFRNISGCIGGSLELPCLGRRYVIGVDLAQTRDYSVILTLDAARRQVVGFQRLQGVSYVEQCTLILETARRYNNAHLVIDETGVGRPVLDNLRATLGRPRTERKVDRRGGLGHGPPRITGITLTSQTKQDLIQRLQLDIERARIKIPAACDVLLRELELYGYEMLPSGRVRYSAPSGFHDDCVIALALAAFGIPREGFSSDDIDPTLRYLIDTLEPYVPSPQRFGLPRRLGLTLVNLGPGPQPGSLGNDLHKEFRLLQTTHAAGLVSADEAEFLAEDLRRRIPGTAFERMGYSDPLDEKFGTWRDFKSGRWKPGRKETA